MHRPRVTKLHRMYPSESQQDHWYYTPDGHVVGPFAFEDEMEEDISRFYNEVDPREDFTTEDWT